MLGSEAVMDDGDEGLLQVRGLTAGYGGSRVLFGVDLDVPARGIVALLGRNGAGKTTLLRTVMGYLRPYSGSVLLGGTDVTGTRPTRLVRQGIGYVPQEHVVFPTLTVHENLLLGRSAAAKGSSVAIEHVLDLFPKLADRLHQAAGTMSGGERKMLGIARALLGDPRLLVLDEPTEGVWHGVVEEIAEHLTAFARGGAVLLVEQNVDIAARIASHVYVLDRGEVVHEGPTTQADRDGGLAALLEM